MLTAHQQQFDQSCKDPAISNRPLSVVCHVHETRLPELVTCMMPACCRCTMRLMHLDIAGGQVRLTLRSWIRGEEGTSVPASKPLCGCWGGLPGLELGSRMVDMNIQTLPLPLGLA